MRLNDGVEAGGEIQQLLDQGGAGQERPRHYFGLCYLEWRA